MENENVSAIENQISPVNSFNEWDPLEEVIVGCIEGACVPAWHISLKATMPKNQWNYFRAYGGQSFPQEQIDMACKELEEFVHILEAEGVTVRRPEIVDHSRPYATPDWRSPGGLYTAMPRDVMLVIGNALIEVPMAWRSRYFEISGYRPLIKEYFFKGAKWLAAPKPQLSDCLYRYDYKPSKKNSGVKEYAITEFEPTFDAADFIRCGKDIFAQKSHVSNAFGINWLRRLLGDEYTIHELDVNDPDAMHIDATFMPLAPGKLLVNPKKIGKLPEMFKSWDIRCAPRPCFPADTILYMSSKWLSMNLLMLDEQRVIVEKHEGPLIKMLKCWGLKPITCSFRNFNAFGGSFHCATLDIRRRGVLRSYF